MVSPLSNTHLEGPITIGNMGADIRMMWALRITHDSE
ncbi:uncharacterized protein G2W53_010130 [Senna tora]|uniref:Uncharacterized protein n=1 Tax=Senna tora TaxID=362788 RepID=A0A835C8Z5_9FABA|nr:uncharacterized protein G2W53_010130 [Senna tora]